MKLHIEATLEELVAIATQGAKLMADFTRLNMSIQAMAAEVAADLEVIRNLMNSQDQADADKAAQMVDDLTAQLHAAMNPPTP